VEGATQAPLIEVTMKIAPVSELKAHLSKYLDQVKAGAEVLITDHGKTVARLTSVPKSDGMETSLAGLVREGLVRTAFRKLPADFLDMPRPRDAKGSVRRALLDERSSGDR
jgi:prevent-host-death family protein